MLPPRSLAALVLVTAVLAKPVVVIDSLVTVPFARYLSGALGSLSLVDQDQARAKTLGFHGTSRASKLSVNKPPSIAVTDRSVFYTAQVGVGSPPATYTLLIDSGSANTWLGSGKAYVKTRTSVGTSSQVSATYGSGAFYGDEYTDTVSLGSGLKVHNQSIGVATEAWGFQGLDGVFGIGPANLTLGTLSSDVSALIPTVVDNLARQGAIPANVVSISFQPSAANGVTNGALTFGGIDPHKYTGSLTYTQITTTYPASRYWGINQSIKYGTHTPILSNGAGIIDTGTSLILLASDAFKRYQNATGAVYDETTGLLRVTAKQYSNLESLFFIVHETRFELTANAQMWPRALNSAIGGEPGAIYLIVGDLGLPSGSGFDFVSGLAFLERFYCVLDNTHRRVGFATTKLTHSTVN